MTLGQKLQKLRLGAALSQEELAARLNVSRQAVSKWELDKAVPDVKYVVLLSDLFQVTTDALLKDGPLPGTESTVPEITHPALSKAGSTASDASASVFPAPAAAPIPETNLNRESLACGILTCGALLFLILILTYLGFYCFAFRPLGLWPLLMILLAGVPLMAAALVRFRQEVPPVSSRPFQRRFALCGTLWAFSITLLCGYCEVVDDLLVSQVMGLTSIPLLIAVTVGLATLFCGSFTLLIHRLLRT